MKYSIIVAFALTLVACAHPSTRPLQSSLAATGTAFAADPAGSAAAPSTADDEIVDVTEVSAEELDNGRVCESRKRPGSNITQTVCYTRDEQAASREKALKDQLDELQREARWRDEVIRQATLEGRRPSGFGLGPN